MNSHRMTPEEIDAMTTDEKIAYCLQTNRLFPHGSTLEEYKEMLRKSLEFWIEYTK